VSYPKISLDGIVALALVRKQARRRLVGIAVGGYVLVLVVTLAWFVPELLAITTDPSAAAEVAGDDELVPVSHLGCRTPGDRLT
jgi:hypothetical protein